MSISVIRVTVECDGCGKQFRVDMDPATKTAGADLYFYAEDFVRGGMTSDGEFCSVQADLQLCGECTSKADSIGDEDYAPTRTEILEKIGAL